MASSHAITTERLVNVLQSIALRQLTGRLSVEYVSVRGKEKGEIFFVQGNTVLARTTHESGETALFSMLHWQEVATTFFEGEQVSTGRGNVQPHSHVSYTTQSAHSSHAFSSWPTRPIEMEETRQTPAIGMPIIPKTLRSIPAPVPTVAPQPHGQVDKTGRAVNMPSLPQLPQTQGGNAQPRMNAIFRALPLASMPRIINQMDRKDRVVFLLLDGKRTLGTIKRMVHRSELDIAHSLVRLLKQGYIEYIQG
ncbi:MAG TPA: DUF4388 domain-containing protein [Ktedonobacteraceae bacterium]|nr:DUF4388 domain-containing protein [Ktedonobacteraceae bacterium]